jgi:hypothetical protein
MIIRSSLPVPVAELQPGWENDLLIGEHTVTYYFEERGAEPEVITMNVYDKPTIGVALAIAMQSEADYRTLPHTDDSSPTRHSLRIRAGDAYANILMRNNLRKKALRRKLPESTRLSQAQRRPLLLPGSHLVHFDADPASAPEETIAYTISNKDGTVTMDQNFFVPNSFLNLARKDPDYSVHLSILLSTLILKEQCLPGRAVRAEPNVLCRNYESTAVHFADFPFFSQLSRGQRVFVHNRVRAHTRKSGKTGGF